MDASMVNDSLHNDIEPQLKNKQISKKVIIISIIGGVILLGLGIVLFANKKTATQTYNPDIQPTMQSQSSIPQTSTSVQWEFNGNNWQVRGNPPNCEEPIILHVPVELSRIQSILYPGQTRGGDYKPHGGFILSGTNNAVITAPLDGMLIHGSRYIEQGEIQYLLFFVNPCGIAYRFDHLLTLAPAIQEAVEFLPQAKIDDSRTTRFSIPISVKQGDVIATAVGFRKVNNISFDLGIYDLRKQNEVSQNAIYADQHSNMKEQSFYAVCWLNLFAEPERKGILSLPAGDEASGAKSDYCK